MIRIILGLHWFVSNLV